MDATFFALVALVLFLALVIYLKVPAKIGASLDSRADDIAKQLDEARKLREEAQALLADYQRKKIEAEREAETIVAEAKHEAERLTAETNKALEEMIQRRTKAAELKIGQAEIRAIAEVRARAAEVAIAAAEIILKDKVSGQLANDLIAKGIGEVATKLN